MTIKYIILIIASCMSSYLLKEKLYANFGYYPESFTMFVMLAAGKYWLSLIDNAAAF